MGSAVSVPTAIALCLITGAIVYGFVQSHPNPPQPVSSRKADETVSSGGKRGKKKKAAQTEQVASASSSEKSAATPIVVPFPAVVPGGFEVDATAAPPTKSKAKKKKAKKAAGASTSSATRADDAQSESSATAPESSTPVPRTKRKSPPVIDSDGPWTRVESRKKPSNRQQESAAGAASPEQATSDAGITTSVTGTSEQTEDEQEQEAERVPDNRRTLAERLLPKPRKTGVEDLLETPDVPPLARVMRVKPRPDEQPAAGFSWADYEDVDDPRTTADDADGEEEGGWIVKSSNRRTKPNTSPSHVPQTAPESLTKKQRQNRAKHEAEKSAKAVAEEQRLAALAQHRRELERTRIAEQYAPNKKVGGGMKASVSGGHLVFE